MAIEDEVNLYTNYYLNQAGGGFNTYQGVTYQRGRGGIGSFLSGLFRAVLPMIKKGGEQIAKEVVRSSYNIVQDIDGETDFKTAFKRRGLEGLQNLQTRAMEAMQGSGYKRSCKRRATTHSKSRRPTKRTKITKRKTVRKAKNKKTAKKRKATRKNDIFG